MFIDEQYDPSEIRRGYLTDEQIVWIPVSNRHCCWTFKPNPYGRHLWGD